MAQTGKRVLVLSYWPLTDVLTQAAILPHLGLLQQISSISEIILVTIERENAKQVDSDLLANYKHVKHVPLYSKNYKFALLNKTIDFILFPKQLQKLARQEKIDTIVASGALAGALALKVWQKAKVPFYVLFEPHADYMADSKVWHRGDPRHIFQKKWEEEQLRVASGLLVVTYNYEQYLLCEKQIQKSRIRLCSNPVDVALFSFSRRARNEIRNQLGWKTARVGIYAGKYGGLYYADRAFQIYQKCFELIPDFRLLILSPQPKKEILQQLQKHKIDIERVYLASVSHKEVPVYLSVADFAFATIKPYPSARYCSPVKIGEYWASGLPVLLTEGVGDDSDIIKNEGGGALFNLQEPESVKRAIWQIQAILQDPTHRQEIPKLAIKYRSPDKIREAYEYFFNQLQQGQ